MKNEKKPLLLASAVILVLIAGVIYYFASGGNISDKTSPQTITEEPSENDHIRGNKESGVTLIEYSDFQCPACGAYYPMVKKLEEELGDKVAFVYRNFPLRQLHPNAQIAAQAAEAAGNQGKFWEMHDTLFEKQKEWSSQNKDQTKETLAQYAQSFGLNADQFKNDLESKETKQKVDDDYSSGTRYEVDATPTFFLNGKKIESPKNYSEFKKSIEEVLAKE